MELEPVGPQALGKGPASACRLTWQGVGAHRQCRDGFTVMVQLHMGPTQSGKEWIIVPVR